MTTPSEAAAALGRIKSPAKAAASRENGKKGGRPRKENQTMLSVKQDPTIDHTNAYIVTIEDESWSEQHIVWTDPDGKGLYEDRRQIEGRSQFDAGKNPSAAIRRYYTRIAR